MFKKADHRQRMSEMLAPRPFNSMLHLREQEDIEIYNESILKGLRERFKQREELRTRLYQTRGKQLVYDNKEILSLLNFLRFQNNQVVYDPKTNKEVPRVEVLQVISGVEEEVAKTPEFPELDFDDLRKYAKKYGYKDLPLNDDIFLNINYIVPVIKYRMRERLWAKELARFKDHLLDVFLDYILETDYPNIDPDEYIEAKKQQIVKEKKLQVYKDQLYDLYIKGMKGENDYIIDRIQFTPDNTLKDMGRSAREINDKILSPEDRTEKIYLQPDDPFLPQYIEDVVIDGKRYASAVHYAYGRMIANLLEIGEMPGLDTFDINDVQLDDIVTTYTYLKRDWSEYNLNVNNETAIKMKIDQYSTIAHLLLATGEYKIIWNDKDPVLGIGPDSNGANNTGHFLEYIRNSYKNEAIHDRLISSYGSIASNVWTNSWMISIAQDFKNTMLLLKNPTTIDLEAIYSVQSGRNTPRAEDIQTLHIAGLDKDQIDIAFPAIVGMYIPMANKTESDVINEEANTYFNGTDYRGEKRNLTNDFEQAKTKLSRLTDILKLADGVTKNKFVMSILSNTQTSDKANARWNRIYKWSH
jgi:predicted NAD-dependent protein-ADP-ribosyltransferase YbiA (DUF1768 family)